MIGNRYSFLVVLLLSFGFSGCSYLKNFKTPTNEDVHLDSSLLQNYTQTLEFQEKFMAPFIANYNYGDKNLVFVAALHTTGSENSTHKTIEKAFTQLSPAFLIVEGSAFTVVSDPDDIHYAEECLKKNFKYCSEDAYAITLAIKNKIPFSYGEPSDAAIHNTLKKTGITDDELIAFYALKDLPKKGREKNAAHLKSALIAASKKVRATKPMNEAKFKKIYKTKMGKEFKYAEISDELVRPVLTQNALWSNKLASAIDALKGQFLVKQIETRLNKHKKVLVVFSASRLIEQRVMLNKAFGDSIDLSVHQQK